MEWVNSLFGETLTRRLNRQKRNSVQRLIWSISDISKGNIGKMKCVRRCWKGTDIDAFVAEGQLRKLI